MASPPATTPEVTDDLPDAISQEALFDVGPGEDAGVLSLAERFIFPPFSVLDARQGAWQERKRNWIGLGLKSEDGRSARMLAKSVNDELVVDPDTGEEYYKGAPPGSVNAKILALSNGQSIFDPVLCEMAYRWFCPPDGRVLDPYAGGSVRGLVAAVTGRYYTGIDLSQDQIDANELQAEGFAEGNRFDVAYWPEWVRADSWQALDWQYADETPVDHGPYDFIWSCPPYHDLEEYSDDPDDLSNMDWDEFARRYRETIAGAVDRLAEDRFAAFVIGEIRDPGGPGYYRNFMGLTIDAFEAAGAAYYNELILVTSVGTLPLRTAKQFLVSRKIGKTHQTVLVFVKGNPRRAAEACREKGALEASLKAAGRTVEQVDDAEDVEGEDDLTELGR